MRQRDGGTARRLETPHVLLVEGVEDARFYEQALKARGASDCVDIRDVGGRQRFPQAVEAVVHLAPRLRSLAVIRDAEEDPDRAFAATRDAFRRSRLAVPARPGVLTPPSDETRTAALVVPRDSPGAIESLCWDSVADRAIARCVDAYLCCARDHMPPGSVVGAAGEAKRRVHALLAVGPPGPAGPLRPGPRLAEAAEAEFWDWNHPAFAPVLAFLDAIARS